MSSCIAPRFRFARDSPHRRIGPQPRPVRFATPPPWWTRQENWGFPVGKYMFQVKYVGDGIKGLMQEGGTKRRAAAEAALASVGGSIEAFNYAFGDVDLIGIADFPDDASAAAISLMINASGAIELKVTPLLTAEDLDAAAAKTPAYNPPGS